MKICVIDIGTNSIHAVFAEIRSTGVFQIIGKEKEMVRLGDGTMLTGRIPEEVMDASLAVLKRLCHLARHRGMSRTVAMATSAIREAGNGGAFLDRIRKETDLRVQILTGEEEGRLIHLAVKNTVELGSEPSLIADIGGGSAEFILASSQGYFWIESLRLGANRLRQIIPLSDPPKKSELKLLEKRIREILRPVLARLAGTAVRTVIGTSGTLMSVGKMLSNGNEDKTAQNGAKKSSLAAASVQTLYARLAGLTLAERRKIKGLDHGRADMMVHGTAVIAALMTEAEIPALALCDKALREGILYDFIEKNRKSLKIEEDIPDIRRRSVVALATRCDVIKGHGEHTARLALDLFDGLKNSDALEASDRDLLEYAALLHDVGYHISFHKHHKHTHYLIVNSEMNGFTPEEIQIIAWTARLHRRDAGKKDADFAVLSAPLRGKILKLASILRIADALDHSHYGLVRNLKAKDDGRTVKISVEAKEDPRWEIHEAEERRELFEKMFARKLEFKNKGGQS
jgi:exopolyphosphatase/guanosine-5'-triphosphate,3'-diphosphate pyrophosphatase